MKTLALMFVLISACSSPKIAPTTATPRTVMIAPIESKSRTLVTELGHAEWSHPQTIFDSTMSSAMPPEKMREAWQNIETDAGRFSSIDGARLEKKDAFQIALVTCKFERLRKVIKVVFDKDEKVAGFFYGPVPEDLEAKTRNFILALSRGEFDDATGDFDDVMRAAAPPSKLAEAAKTIDQKSGHFQSIERVELQPNPGTWAELAHVNFEREKVVIKVVYDGRDQIVGFFLVPPPVAWTPPSYAKADSFEERVVSVGTTPALPGTLTLPKGSGPFPAIVLVHGSGPNDQDESLGGTKIFKDLAWGLASQGVAVLRYTKRTKQSAAGVVTQKEEVIDGAHDAIELLRNSRQIDPKKIFVLGHSQGAGLAPRIAKENPALAGIVLLAGPTRPFEDILIDQFNFFAAKDPENAALAAKVKAAKAFKKVVEDPSLRPDQDVELPTGGVLKGAYFLDMRGYDAAAVAASLACKMLILQGDRDYQVTRVDFEGFAKALATKKNATLKTYPSLNHLFVSGEGAPGPSEYERLGHIDETVVNDIARWVQK